MSTKNAKEIEGFFQQTSDGKFLEMEVFMSKKRALFWEFAENLKKVEDLEVDITKLKKRNEQLEEAFPDLAQLRGIEEKVYKGKLFQVKTSDGSKMLFGKDKNEVLDSYEKKKEKRKANQEPSTKKMKQ